MSPSAARRRGIPGDPLAQSLAREYLIERREEQEAAARSRRAPRPWRHILSIAAIVLCGAVWLVPSLGTRPFPAGSAQREDAGARVTLYLAAQRIREFEQRHGRLPRTLAQAGVFDAQIEYRLTGATTFVLDLSRDGRHWDLASSAADTAYMRDAFAGLGLAPKGK